MNQKVQYLTGFPKISISYNNQSRFQAIGQDSVYALFSKINHKFFQYDCISYNYTSDTPPTSQQHLTSDLTELFKGYLIKNQAHISFSESFLTGNSKVLDRDLHIIYFKQSTTYYSDITVSLIIKPHILHSLLNNTLQGTGNDSLKGLFTITNHSFFW